jgi:hypothetical protein
MLKCITVAPEPPVALTAVSRLISDTRRPNPHRAGAQQDAAAEGNGELAANELEEELAASDGKRPRCRNRRVPNNPPIAPQPW